MFCGPLLKAVHIHGHLSPTKIPSFTFNAFQSVNSFARLIIKKQNICQQTQCQNIKKIKVKKLKKLFVTHLLTKTNHEKSFNNRTLLAICFLIYF